MNETARAQIDDDTRLIRGRDVRRAIENRKRARIRGREGGAK